MTKSALTDANNKYAPDGIDHVVCDFRQFVDSENSFNLSKQSTQEPEVASCDSGDARHRLSVCEVRPIELQAELLHVACEHERWFIAERWTIVMGEADSAVELRVAGMRFSMPGITIRIGRVSLRSKTLRIYSRAAVLRRSASSGIMNSKYSQGIMRSFVPLCWLVQRPMRLSSSWICSRSEPRLLPTSGVKKRTRERASVA